MVFGVVEPRLGRRLDAVVGVTPPITGKFEGGSAQLLTVRNFPAPEALSLPSAAVDLPSPRTLVLGGVLDAQRLGLETVEAVALLAARWPDLHLLHIGDLGSHPFGNAMLARAAELDIAERVVFRPRLPWAALQAYLAASVAGLVLLRDSPGGRYALPTRLTEFMAQGVPVIATDFPILRGIVGEADAGLLISDGTPGSIADAIEHLLIHPERGQAMGARGREAVRCRYNWGHELAALDALYARL
jgi:glycosyltransferase involved in cell wall biosynthesis